MKVLSASKQEKIRELATEGHSNRAIAKQLGVGHTTVRKYRISGAPSRSCANAGRRKKLSARQERFLVAQVTRLGQDTATCANKVLKNELNVHVHDSTARRALSRAGLNAKNKVKKPMISAKNKRARLAWCQERKNWTSADWKRVIWSDETKINRFTSDGRSWCWAFDNKTLNHRTVKPTLKFGGGGIMLWGCITADGVGGFTRIEGRMNSAIYCGILAEQLIPTMEKIDIEKSNVIFQHDNDPKHTSKETNEWLKNHNINVMKWPAQSPDLNPIEHVWAWLKIRLNKYESPPDGLHELERRVMVEWARIDKESILKIIMTMPDRVAAVIKAKGGWTKY